MTLPDLQALRAYEDPRFNQPRGCKHVGLGVLVTIALVVTMMVLFLVLELSYGLPFPTPGPKGRDKNLTKGHDTQPSSAGACEVELGEHKKPNGGAPSRLASTRKVQHPGDWNEAAKKQSVSPEHFVEITAGDPVEKHPRTVEPPGDWKEVAKKQSVSPELFEEITAGDPVEKHSVKDSFERDLE
ncbi:hypothetical protein R1sor_024703 [Riccia sorocarpa]|uniref:Uncharacterized protein n=1 Tax=Riccia sorocarpa TaxID=122646 RepID=A0ABD3GTH6_9MARC